MAAANDNHIKSIGKYHAVTTSEKTAGIIERVAALHKTCTGLKQGFFKIFFHAVLVTTE
jgi:hypothetical protein